MKPLRDRDPDSYRHITIRTHDGKFYLRPNRTVRRIIGGIIARYQEMLDIEIYAYAFLSNHYHLIIRAPHSNVDAFTGHLNREIARRMNYLNKRTGSIWPRPYTDQKILSEEDLLEAFLYITTNPTRCVFQSKCPPDSGN
jgi:putative transposase